MKLVERLRPLLREPLVHFLVAGLALFFVLGRGEESADSESRTITVSEQQIARLAANWEQTWQRPPTEQELEGLIDDFVREEIYYREALRLGLDEGDTVIRRRLRSKMEFLARSEVEAAAPDDATLQAWLDENPARYAEGTQLSFDQIYLGAEGDGRAELQRLRAGVSPSELGISIPLPAAMANVNLRRVEREFGQQFAREISSLEPGDWQGPVASGFGQHLVRITAREEGEPPSLEDVRQRVENDWRAATLAEREEEAFRILRDGYSVSVEGRDE